MHTDPPEMAAKARWRGGAAKPGGAACGRSYHSPLPPPSSPL